jgi:hypothetical protein
MKARLATVVIERGCVRRLKRQKVGLFYFALVSLNLVAAVADEGG